LYAVSGEASDVRSTAGYYPVVVGVAAVFGRRLRQAVIAAWSFALDCPAELV
jgi:hypothetical protein